MKPTVLKEAIKIWDRISVGEKLDGVKLELEFHKKLLNIFQVGDFYYYIFNLISVRLD